MVYRGIAQLKRSFYPGVGSQQCNIPEKKGASVHSFIQRFSISGDKPDDSEMFNYSPFEKRQIREYQHFIRMELE